jgi:hypothetical protein
MRMLLFTVIAIAVLGLSASAQSKSLSGVWSLTEINAKGPDGEVRKSAQPGMYLFTKTHYSMIYVNSDKPRDDIDDLSKATADQLRSVFVTSLVANAGTYEYKDGKLTVHPTVAKLPGYMKAGTWTAWTVKSDGDSMTLVSDSSNAGPETNPTTFKLKRVE